MQCTTQVNLLSTNRHKSETTCKAQTKRESDPELGGSEYRMVGMGVDTDRLSAKHPLCLYTLRWLNTRTRYVDTHCVSECPNTLCRYTLRLWHHLH